jgi:hypothetical protein
MAVLCPFAFILASAGAKGYTDSGDRPAEVTAQLTCPVFLSHL